MRILIAPNPFKGTLSALEAARAMARGVSSTLPGAEVELLPISDGGDGLIEALAFAGRARLRTVSVTGPLGERRKAAFALLPGATAVVEMARASGLGLLGRGRRDPMGATSRGTGELILAALRAGAKTVLVGLGGSATNDGGAGMAQALGARLLDARGRELGPGVAELLRLAGVETGGLTARLKGVRVIGVSDVTNPLLGPRGSARVYGPQKGASPAQVRLIEAALSRYARVLARDLGVSVARRPGAGAAGGLGAGLLAFLKARIVPGAELVLDRAGADRALAAADAVLTGEGRLDETSFYGKAPVELARRAKARGVPVAAVCAGAAPGLAARLLGAGIREVATLAQAGASRSSSLARAAFWVEKAAGLAVRRLLLSGLAAGALLAAPARATDIDYHNLDQLYWHRHEGDNLAHHLERIAELMKDSRSGEEDPELLWRRCRALVRRAEGIKKKGKRLAEYAAARADCKKAAALQPGSAEAHFWHGVAMGRWGETKGLMRSVFLVKPIRKEMQATLKLDPSHGGAHHVLAEILFQVPSFAGGDKKKALKEFEEAVRVSPTYTANYAPLAKAYLALGMKAEARAVLERALEVSEPADPAEYERNLAEAKDLLERLKD